MTNRPSAIAMDLGSTRFKLGVLDAAGGMSDIQAIPAPALRGDGLIREGDPQVFLDTANRLLDEFAGRVGSRNGGVPLGLVCQRSTFTVWNRQTGETLTPMISWQDRRAADWCERHSAQGDRVVDEAGLLLSPHYVGPKFAAERMDNPLLASAIENGDAMIGTLDSWLIWNWTRGRNFRTDLTMAARTALASIDRAGWSADLLDLFDVPVAALAEIGPTAGYDLAVRDGLRLTASIADQASGALSVLAPKQDMALVNFGTGAFVLYPAADVGVRRPGYLTAPIFAGHAEETLTVLEGTINGAGPALDFFAPGPTGLPETDPCPDGFAIPDRTGLGSPHWRADLGLTLSKAALDLPPDDQRRVVLEGLLFRVLEILFDLGAAKLPERVLISGGLVRDASIGLGLAQLIGGPVEQLDQSETTLLGAARLAAGLNPYASPARQVVNPSESGAYLPKKFARWQAWMRERLSQSA